MSDQLTERLNVILPKVVSAEFLSGSGIGNEIPFYIFDYPPEDELRVRAHIQFLLEHIPKLRSGLQVKHVSLFDLAIEHLKARRLLEGSFTMQREKGDEYLLKKLKAVLDAEKIARVFVETAQPDQHDLVLVSQVGSAWPVLRSHDLLNNLHSRMGKTPLVLFYPGCYDGTFLRLFGKVKSYPYYRAFRLVP